MTDDQNKATKVKRKASAYASFVKQHYHDKEIEEIKNSKLKIKRLAELWREHKAKTVKDA